MNINLHLKKQTKVIYFMSSPLQCILIVLHPYFKFNKMLKRCICILMV